jgi:2-polyprenyl-3-methyl-5-hydroxy-6-metoxy-1,4-benzoquinol methylase
MKEQFIDDFREMEVDETLHKEIREKILKRVSVILPYLVGKEVLSVGCGSGFCENEYLKVAKSVTGVDISEKAISYANEHYKGIEFYCFDVRGIYPNVFSAGSFDGVLATEFLEHMSKKDGHLVVDSIHHILKDGGLFIGTVPVEDDVGRDQYHKSHYSREELENLLGEYFRDVQIDKLEHPHPQYFFGSSWLFRGVKK